MDTDKLAKLRAVCEARAVLLANDDDLETLIQRDGYLLVFNPSVVKAMLDVIEVASTRTEHDGSCHSMLYGKECNCEVGKLVDALAALAEKVKDPSPAKA